ncbi:tetratricopeptide repeat protein [Agrobacterium larrymoorei]|uniref:tetratricopeptide repeat protein n=1 Tax=Agrobacterium larrymoorei TaxID=160699 RepID=UPI0030C212C9
MNKKPLLLSAAVLALCAAGIYQSRDALLGRVSAVHSAPTQGAGTHAFAAGLNNADVQKGDGPLALGNKQPSSSATSSADVAQAPRTTQQAPQNTVPTPQAGAGAAAPVVDESALRYFAARGDTARLQAEIARLKALYPNWTPPADPAAAAPTGDPQLEGIWQLYATGRYSEARKAIADRQAAEAGWQPPDNLTQMLDLAEARQRLVNASDLKQYSAVLGVASENPGLLTCSEVDVLWRVAEAFARTEKPERARDAYGYVLTNCQNPAERLATVQKASTLLPLEMMEDLLSREKPGPDGQLEFEPVKDDLARQFVAKAGEDPKVKVPPAYLSRMERLAETNKLASDALLLGWYNVEREKMDDAEKWFRRAKEVEDSASASEGLALALVARGEPREAEDIMFKWRDASDGARATYLAAAANLLALDPPVTLEPDVLQRIATETVARKDAATAQEFGWYSRAFQQPQMAQQWFSTALQWKPDDEPSAYGLALTYQELNNLAEVRRLQSQWGSQSQRILEIGRPTAQPGAVTSAPAATASAPVQSQPRAIAAAPRMVAPQSTTVAYEAAPPPQARATRGTRQSGRCSVHSNPESLSAQAALQQAWCLMEANRPAEAVKAFSAALKNGEPTVRGDAAYGQSLAYLRMGLTDNAAVSATKSSMDRQKATELQVAILTDRALAAYESKHYEEALILLDQRARYATERVDLMVIRGYAYLNMKRYGEAVQIFEASAATGNADAIRGLATAQNARPSRGPQGG